MSEQCQLYCDLYNKKIGPATSSADIKKAFLTPLPELLEFIKDGVKILRDEMNNNPTPSKNQHMTNLQNLWDLSKTVADQKN